MSDEHTSCSAKAKNKKADINSKHRTLRYIGGGGGSVIYNLCLTGIKKGTRSNKYVSKHCYKSKNVRQNSDWYVFASIFSLRR
jgi:hypothetical protein